MIIAPEISDEAKAAVAQKKNVRLLETGHWDQQEVSNEYKRVTGGLLVQDRDLGSVSEQDLKIVTKTQPTEEQIRDLLFCWKVAKYVKSNAIVYAKNGMTKLPQTMINVRLPQPVDIKGNAVIDQAVADAEKQLARSGRVLLRPSGTEPVIRVMVEGENPDQVQSVAEHLAHIVESELLEQTAA